MARHRSCTSFKTITRICDRKRGLPTPFDAGDGILPGTWATAASISCRTTWRWWFRTRRRGHPAGSPAIESIPSIYPAAGSYGFADAAILLTGLVAIPNCLSRPCRKSITRRFSADVLSGSKPDGDGDDCDCAAGAAIRRTAGLEPDDSTSSGGTSVIVLQFNLTMAIDVAEEEVQSASVRRRVCCHPSCPRRDLQ